MRYVTPFLVLISVVFISWSSQAHHSASGYNVDATATVSGVVDRLQWRNPHVIIRLAVEDENGNTTMWPLESAGLTQLVKDGWSKDLLAPGTPLTVEIRPTVKGIPGGIIRWVVLADGRVLPFDPDSPEGIQITETTSDKPAEKNITALLKEKSNKRRADYLSRRAAVEELESSNRPEVLPKDAGLGQAGALDPDNQKAHEGVAVYDFTGVWQHRFYRDRAEKMGAKPWHFLPVPELTQKAKDTYDDIMARRATGDATADPATMCYPHGLMRSMTRVGNMMLLQQNTAVYMVHRMNNDYRAVYWDGRDHVDESVRVDSYNGDSIAIWEDDHLFVETIGFGSAHHYVNEGIPIGKQGRVEERWRLINDGNTLEIEYRMTDPEHWVGEWVDTKHWDRIYGADIREANCIVAEDAELAIGGSK